MDVINLDDKRDVIGKIRSIIGTENFCLSYVNDDGSVANLVNTDVRDLSLILNVLRVIYLDNALLSSDLQEE